MPRHLDQQLKLRLLRAVDAIGAHGSILAASRALSVTQPALTRSLHRRLRALDIHLADHRIDTPTGCFSFRDAGLL